MQQHPVPQNISQYQFRLVGDMTLKQFLELASGIAIAVVIYLTNLPSPIKWPFAGLSAFLGFALAFMPIEERPLDQWFIAYIKAIYHPTRFIWQKNHSLPSYFSFQPRSSVEYTPSKQDVIARNSRRQAGLSTFIKTLPFDQTVSPLEAKENQNLEFLNQLFYQDIKNLSHSPVINSSSPAISTTKPKPTNSSQPHRQTAPNHHSLPNNNIRVVNQTPIKIKKQDSSPPPPFSSTNHSQSTPLPQPATPTHSPASVSQPVKNVEQTPTLPFPSTPTTPNTVVGMILTKDNKIVENAILEIKDQNGLPVRATKSNKLGQFFSTTPLKNGTYTIEVEKPGLNFPIQKITLNGNKVNPLKIQST